MFRPKFIPEKYFGNRQAIQANVSSMQLQMVAQLEALKSANKIGERKVEDFKKISEPAAEESNKWS